MSSTHFPDPAPGGGVSCAEGAPERVRCLNPFRWLEVNQAGVVTPCCAWWFLKSLGNAREQSLEEIWNGPVYQELRQAMYPGGKWQKFCNPKTCPQIYNDTWVRLDELRPDTPDSLPIDRTLIEDLRARHTVMSQPPLQIGLSCDARCNLRCVMCPGANAPKHSDGGELLRRALAGIRSFLPGVRRIKLMGDGEVFAVPESRQFLFDFDSAANPDTSFLLHTNGTLLTPALWQRIERLKIDWMVVSVDAACQKTYEKIRVGGHWPTLMDNLEFLAQKRREGAIRELHLSMTVMRSNHRELAEFARLGLRLGATSAYLTPILGDFGREQIFDRPDAGCLRRIARQLRDPVMAEPGIDTNGLNPWRNYRPTARDRLRQFKRWLKDLAFGPK